MHVCLSARGRHGRLLSGKGRQNGRTLADQREKVNDKKICLLWIVLSKRLLCL